MSPPTSPSKRNQENQIIKQAEKIEFRRRWEKAKRKGFPTSDGMYGKQYCMNCHTVWNCEWMVSKDKRFLETCGVCNPKERNY